MGKGSTPQKKALCPIIPKRFVVDAKVTEPLGQWRQLNTRENILDRMICSHYIPLRKYIGDAMKEFIKVMKALSDSNRVALLKLLQKREMCVCQIWPTVGIAQPTASKHLRILEDAGLVDRKKEGLWVHYSLSNGDQSPYAASLLGNLNHWLEDDPKIQELCKRSEGIRREEICRSRG